MGFEEFNLAVVCCCESAVGSIQNVNYDFPHFYGIFTPLGASDEYRQLFAFLMNEDAEGDPPFGSQQLDEENWWIKMPDGERIEISLPAIDFDGGTIDWRLRS